MNEMIGVLPAAGRGSRLGPVPCSKEIMPLGFEASASQGQMAWRPVTAIEAHLRSFRQAAVTRTAVIVSDQKFDVIRYLGDGGRYGVSIGYFFQQRQKGMPFAIDLVSDWVGDADVLFAMPDTYIEPADTLAALAEYHRIHQPDVSLGLFRTSTPQKYGMVDVDARGRPTTFVDKPSLTHLDLMWGFAAWSAKFTRFLSRFLASLESHDAECVLSDVFLAGLQAGMVMHTVRFDDASYRDIGTPEDFQAVVYELALREAQRLTTKE